MSVDEVMMQFLARDELCTISDPGVMILRTDTVYGLHARVTDGAAIDALKYIKERDDERYFITLISDRSHIGDCGIVLSDAHRRLLDKIRPGPYTVLLSDQSGQTHSFRWPDHPELLSVIDAHGPLYSTSANRHGKPTLSSPQYIDDVMATFVDVIVDSGECQGSSSSILQLLR